MSEFGYKIKNYQAASIYEYNLGLRSKPDETNAMLSNSLFKDFLVSIGLNVWKEESTRDIVCVEFEYGTKDLEFYKEKLKIDHVILKRIAPTYKKLSKAELRERFYVDGFNFTYKKYDKDSNSYIPDETIHYKMLYRTPGKAKKGTCMFINEKLYDQAREFLYMGIQLPEKNAPIVEIGAYSSLITSSIVGTVKIEPEELLIMNDVDSFFNTDVVKICLNEAKQCYAKRESNYEVKNTMFDGQALIDYSIFPEWGNGYILLRQHFTKCAAFKTDIKRFMIDHYGDKYHTATITDMFGREVKVDKIRMITTDNAIKWLKFDGITFDYWAEWIRKNGSLWGIVKTAHESKLGSVQRMSYQMNNALDIETMDAVVKESVDYINKLKSDNNEFLSYLKKNQNFSNDFEVLISLVEHNPDFVNCDYFRERKKHIIYAYTLGVKSGHTIQNGDNLTIVGSPYAMLMHAIGLDPLSDPTFKQEDGCMQCWTSRFKDGEYLAEFRSPFNSRNNMGYMHNVYHEYFDKYFDFGELIVAVNMNGTSFQDKNNGSDQDSDSCYTTNQPDIVEHAKYCYENYPTIVNDIPKEKNVYSSSLKDFAKVDNNLASAQLAIGESSNIAQLALTYTYNFDNQKYDDAVCILSVLAQVAIDNSKRKFDVDLTKEIKRIKETLDIDKNGLPDFWILTKKDKRKTRTEEQRIENQKKNKQRIRAKINKDLVCPMNEIYKIKPDEYHFSGMKPISEYLIKHEIDGNRRKSRKVEELIERYSIQLYNSHFSTENDDEYIILRDDFNKLIEDIRSMYISKTYTGLMYWLINRAFVVGDGAKRTKEVSQSKTEKNKSLLMSVLYNVNKEAFLQCFRAFFAQ